MRTGIKYQGLINVSGFHVDPGYQGNLIYAVYNASPSPVQICENDRLFKIWFADMDRESEDRFVYTKPGVTEISNDLVRGMSKEILSLQSLAEKMRNHENDTVAKFAEQRSVIDTLNIVWRTIIIAAILATARCAIQFGISYRQAMGPRDFHSFVAPKNFYRTNTAVI